MVRDGDYYALWIDPESTNRKITGADQGALVTFDDSASCSSLYNQSTKDATAGATEPSTTLSSGRPSFMKITHPALTAEPQCHEIEVEVTNRDPDDGRVFILLLDDMTTIYR